VTALAIILAGVLAGALAFAATMAAFALRNGSRAADARVDAADLRGDLQIATDELDRAADSIAKIDRARLRQVARADALEAELHDVEAVAYADPAVRAGRARLRAALQAAADADAERGDRGVKVPDPAPTEPASSPGD
jgi:hypothetical protein